MLMPRNTSYFRCLRCTKATPPARFVSFAAKWKVHPGCCCAHCACCCSRSSKLDALTCASVRAIMSACASTALLTMSVYLNGCRPLQFSRIATLLCWSILLACSRAAHSSFRLVAQLFLQISVAISSCFALAMVALVGTTSRVASIGSSSGELVSSCDVVSLICMSSGIVNMPRASCTMLEGVWSNQLPSTLQAVLWRIASVVSVSGITLLSSFLSTVHVEDSASSFPSFIVAFVVTTSAPGLSPVCLFCFVSDSLVSLQVSFLAHALCSGIISPIGPMFWSMGS